MCSEVPRGACQASNRLLLFERLYASVGIQAAYLHIPIYPPHQCYMSFAVGEQHYQFVTLHFYLSLAFTKVLAPILALPYVQGIHVVGCLYDLLLKNESSVFLSGNIQWTMEILQSIGLILSL